LFSGLAFFVLLLIFIGAVLEIRNNPEANFDMAALLIGGALLIFMAMMFISGIGMMTKMSWAQRLNDFIAAIGLSCLMLLMLFIGIRAMFYFQEEIPGEKWRGLFIISILLWPVVSICFFVSAWKSRKKDALFRSPVLASLWPLLIFIKSPAICLILLLIYLIFVGGGEWIGSFFHYPIIGAWIGFGLLVLLAFLAILRESRKD
jgi:hypothetical protein